MQNTIEPPGTRRRGDVRLSPALTVENVNAEADSRRYSGGKSEPKSVDHNQTLQASRKGCHCPSPPKNSRM
jgi:hypothetical protein